MSSNTSIERSKEGFHNPGMGIGDRIKLLRTRNALSQEQFGAAFKVTREAVSQWEKGKSTPEQQKLEAIATKYEVTLDWLAGKGPDDSELISTPPNRTEQMVGSRSQPALEFLLENRRPLERDLPLRGHGRAGKEGFFLDQGETWGYVMRPESLRGVNDAYAVRVFDSSMSPRFEHGHVLQVDPRRPPRPGDNVVIQLKDGQAFVKVLVRRTEKVVVCEQFQPRETVEYKPTQVAAIHMVVGIDFLER